MDANKINTTITVNYKQIENMNALAKKLAADDLYSAVEELLNWAASVEGTEVSEGITQLGGDNVFTRARAALAKAKL